jgi:hypothetical protein
LALVRENAQARLVRNQDCLSLILDGTQPRKRSAPESTYEAVHARVLRLRAHLEKLDAEIAVLEAQSSEGGNDDSSAGAA